MPDPDGTTWSIAPEPLPPMPATAELFPAPSTPGAPPSPCSSALPATRLQHPGATSLGAPPRIPRYLPHSRLPLLVCASVQPSLRQHLTQTQPADPAQAAAHSTCPHRPCLAKLRLPLRQHLPRQIPVSRRAPALASLRHVPRRATASPWQCLPRWFLHPQQLTGAVPVLISQFFTGSAFFFPYLVLPPCASAADPQPWIFLLLSIATIEEGKKKQVLLFLV